MSPIDPFTLVDESGFGVLSVRAADTTANIEETPAHSRREVDTRQEMEHAGPFLPRHEAADHERANRGAEVSAHVHDAEKRGHPFSGQVDGHGVTGRSRDAGTKGTQCDENHRGS